MLFAVFALFAVAAIVSAVVVVLHRNPVVSTMSLVVTLVASAGLFIMLGSPFLAGLQILLYTGAILVLFLFVIMLLNVQRERSTATQVNGMVIGAGICALVFAGALVRLLVGAHGETQVPELDPAAFSLASAARSLFGSYLLPFEMIGLLLLVAVVGASWVAQRNEPPGSAPDSASASEAEGER